MKHYRNKEDAVLTETDAKHGFWKMMDKITGCGSKFCSAI